MSAPAPNPSIRVRHPGGQKQRAKDVKILSRPKSSAADSKIPLIPLPDLCVHPLAQSTPSGLYLSLPLKDNPG